MYSEYTTLEKQYRMKTDKFICNKFGLAEFFAKHYKEFGGTQRIHTLDVGCGALPMGIFLADQFQCNVMGVELNPTACRCANENIEKFNLKNAVEIINADFSVFSKQYAGKKFDLIIANPPLDDRVTHDDILKYADNTYETLDSDSFAFLTNSWHSAEEKDLADYIFEFGQNNLKPDGRVILVFCMIDCSSPDYVYKKAANYGYKISWGIDDYISSESIGAESLGIHKVHTFMTEFKR